MVKDFRLIEFASIVESLEKVVTLCSKDGIYTEDTKEVLNEVSDLITDDIYTKLKEAIGRDFIFKVANVKESNFKAENESKVL